MLPRLRSLASEQIKGQLYFRILPISVKVTKQFKDNSCTSWVFYLEKGMQILGRTVQFQASLLEDEYVFNPNENKFDFQIASQKNFNYTWSLYSIDDSGLEERLAAQTFCIKDYYQKQQKENNRSGYDLEVKFNNLTLKFKLFIQNNMSNIIDLINGVVPESQEEITKAFANLTKKPQANGILRERNKQKQKQTTSQIIQPEKQKQIEQASKIKSKSSIQNNVQNEPKGQKDKKKPISTPITPSKIQEQEQQQSHSSTNKPQTDSKLTINVQNINLQSIYQDKQKQDLVTPMYSKFNKPGFFQNAFSQASHKEYIKQSHQQQNLAQQQNKQPKIIQQKVKQFQQQLKYETPGQPVPQSSVEEQKTSKVLKKSLKIEPEITSTKNNFKKLIIILLIIVLFGGIIGSLLTKQNKTKKVEIQTKTKNKKVKVKKIKV